MHEANIDVLNSCLVRLTVAESGIISEKLGEHLAPEPAFSRSCGACCAWIPGHLSRLSSLLGSARPTRHRSAPGPSHARSLHTPGHGASMARAKSSAW